MYSVPFTTPEMEQFSIFPVLKAVMPPTYVVPEALMVPEQLNNIPKLSAVKPPNVHFVVLVLE